MSDDTDLPASIADVHARIAQLSPEKRALLAKRLRGGAAPGGVQTINGLPRPMRVPLSYAQQRLWFLHQWEGETALYNIFQGWWLQGHLDEGQLRRAVGQLIARHESLRTVFVDDGGEPTQEVLAHVAVEVPLADLCTLPGDLARAEALAQAQALCRQGFDLTRAPLLRLTLVRLAESTHLLVLVMHHIVSDGWSMGVFYRELGALYAGNGDPLPALPAQYTDYSLWQRAEAQEAARERQLAYWRVRLAGLTTLELPADRPRPLAPSYRGARHRFALSAELSAALKQVSRHEGVTLYMLLLAAFQVLLARYSGQGDIAVGSPIAGRTHPELEGLIGFFVNTLVLRTDLSGNPRFRDVLAQVRENALDAYAHQEVPFEKLVEDLKPERDASRNPLFQAMFVLQNVPGGGLTLPGLDVTPQTIESGAAKFDLTLTLTEEPTHLRGSLQYATDLFDAPTVTRFTSHFITLLEAIVADPETPVGEFPLLTPAERHQLLVEWNDTAADYPRDRCIHQLFKAQAARTPDSVAVVCEDQQLTYAELDARADRLAHNLCSKGVGPDVLVGICMERSLDMVVGLLGILKAGGAYVPIDPRYPEERLRFILEDTGLTLLLTDRSLAERLAANRCTAVLIDSPLPDAGPGHGVPKTMPNHLAYVIYTSGSTGEPKGVAIEHHSTVSFLHWVRAMFTDEELFGVLCATSICFDLSVFELFGALCWGGKVILVESATDLATCRHRDDVTLVNTVPSIMQTLLEAQGLPDSVVTVNLAGEPLREALANALLAHGSIRRVNDLYGPTETTTYSTSAVRALFQPATIGKPIANTQVYLLDPCLNPVPIGVTGELCIGGEGVARGYLNRRELTAERFIPDPFHREPDARLYRTGDLARYRPDGSIELLGRADSQIKLRGFRIELGEIEVVLARHPEVREAAVVVREDVPGYRRLVAYVVARDDSPAIGNLRALIEQQLPHYMVPAAFVVLPSLPLTPNGKVDRKLLPAPEFEDSERAFESPCTTFETAIAEICGEVLNLPGVGRNDNFFDLGGHSLLAMQFVSRINRALGIELTLRQLFETPDVRGLALVAQRSMMANAASKTSVHTGVEGGDRRSTADGRVPLE